VKDIAAALDVSRRTIHNIEFFRQRAICVGKHSPRWHTFDLRLYLTSQSRAFRETR
jgi:hypothetical protein